jgi:hypothetical protein
MRCLRLAAALLVSLGIVSILCAASAEAEPGPDISRVVNVKGDFPPGFGVEVHPAAVVGQRDVEDPEFASLAGARLDPPQCRSAVIPPYAEPAVGTEAAGVTADGDQGGIDVVAYRSPEPIPLSEAPAGCDRVLVFGDPEDTGVIERIPAPNIAGVSTTASKLTTNEEPADPEYLFTAAIDDRIAVVVTGSAEAGLNPQQFLSDLLVKATAAVRGQ